MRHAPGSRGPVECAELAGLTRIKKEMARPAHPKTPDALVDYYSRRAPEYEEVFHRPDPERQAEQQELAAAMTNTLRGRRILEVACGTGYWTERLAPVAAHIMAVDSSLEMLALARKKQVANVEWQQQNAYELEEVPGYFDGGLANFWLSHVPKSRLSEFLDGFHSRLARQAPVFMADNMNVPGLGGELISRGDGSDTYKRRRLSDGSVQDIVKNYFRTEDLHQLLSPRVRALEIHIGRCFWWVRYQTAPAANRS